MAMKLKIQILEVIPLQSKSLFFKNIFSFLSINAHLHGCTRIWDKAIFFSLNEDFFLTFKVKKIKIDDKVTFLLNVKKIIWIEELFFNKKNPSREKKIIQIENNFSKQK